MLINFLPLTSFVQIKSAWGGRGGSGGGTMTPTAALAGGILYYRQHHYYGNLAKHCLRREGGCVCFFFFVRPCREGRKITKLARRLLLTFINVSFLSAIGSVRLLPPQRSGAATQGRSITLGSYGHFRPQN